MARLAAIEAQFARYIPLVCGHKTTLEVHDLYLNFQSKKGTSFCETCGDWRQIAKPPKPPADYPPPESLF